MERRPATVDFMVADFVLIGDLLLRASLFSDLENKQKK